MLLFTNWNDGTLLFWDFLQKEKNISSSISNLTSDTNLAVLVLYKVALLQLHRLTHVSRYLPGDVLAVLGRDTSADRPGHLATSLATHGLALLLGDTLAILPLQILSNITAVRTLDMRNSPASRCTSPPRCFCSPCEVPGQEKCHSHSIWKRNSTEPASGRSDTSPRQRSYTAGTGR